MVFDDDDRAQRDIDDWRRQQILGVIRMFDALFPNAVLLNQDIAELVRFERDMIAAVNMEARDLGLAEPGHRF